MLENHSYGEVLGGPSAPFLASLAASGAVLTQSFAITHPSEPNYLALFSGSTQGLTDDSCPHQYAGPNLGASLLAAGRTFAGYSEDLPVAGLHRVRQRRVRAKAQPMGRLHQRAERGSTSR